MKIKQLNIDCYSCQGNLNDPVIIKVMEAAAKKCGAKVIGNALQKYPEYGITAIVFLAESHVLISTYPEMQFAALEIFLCNEKLNVDACWEEIKGYLRPKNISVNEFYHDIKEKQNIKE